MANSLLPYRYCLFAFFLIFNAIICSIAVWNYSIAQALLFTFPVIVYLAVLGGVAVLFIISITFVDVFRRNALIGHVWFEIVWVAALWVLELCAASAYTALVPDSMCTVLATSLEPDACTSSRVLQAFSWMCTILLLFYLLALSICSLLHHDDDPAIWHSSVRFYPWFATRSTLGSAPSSPTKEKAAAPPTFQRKSFKLAAPRPSRPVRPADLDLEAGANVSGGPTTAPAMQQAASRQSASIPPQTSTLYPASVAAKLGSAARAPPRTDPTPPPLGDWPRSMRQQSPRALPSRPGHSFAPREPSITEVSPTAAPTPRESRPPRTAGSSARPAHGPRRGSNGSPTRRPPPPPLDLTRISAYNKIEERRNELR